VAGDADVADQAVVPRAHRALDRPATPGRDVELVDRADRVELQQVDAIDAETLQRATDPVVRAARGPFAGLRREEDAIADTRIHGASRSSESP
jgi:hypothetical protein